MRLHHYLARAGVASRRKAEDLIRDGRVSVNGKVAQVGDIVLDGQTVTYDGEKIRLPSRIVVIALNKPRGFTTTHEDRHAEKLVFELVPEHPGLHAIGRLDKDTEGLLLLTNDGGLTQIVSHPSHGVPKLYRAWSKRGRLSEIDCRKLVEGVQLSDGFAKAVEAVPIKDGVKLIMNEGKKREVRRLLGKIGHPVSDLVRLAVGVIELQDLPVGQYRYLNAEEIKMLRDNVMPPKLRKNPSESKIPEGRSSKSTAPRPKSSGRSKDFDAQKTRIWDKENFVIEPNRETGEEPVRRSSSRVEKPVAPKELERDERAKRFVDRKVRVWETKNQDTSTSRKPVARAAKAEEKPAERDGDRPGGRRGSRTTFAPRKPSLKQEERGRKKAEGRKSEGKKSESAEWAGIPSTKPKPNRKAVAKASLERSSEPKIKGSSRSDSKPKSRPATRRK